MWQVFPRAVPPPCPPKNHRLSWVVFIIGSCHVITALECSNHLLLWFSGLEALVFKKVCRAG